MTQSVQMIDYDNIVETASSTDASCRWYLRQRKDGLFSYQEYRYSKAGPDWDVEGYWGLSYTSGLFDTAQAARADALDALSWLPGQL
jgi:hypothetical protein